LASTSYPIILAHGICPFDGLVHPFFPKDNKENDRLHYFRKIRSTLRSHGFEAFHARVGWASSLEKRAGDLRRQLEILTNHFTTWSHVHIIAHSMGGLDSRWMIYEYRMEERVRSLTTIGTPHLGTSFADWGVRRFNALITCAGWWGLDIEGFRALTRKACDGLNRVMEDFEGHNGVNYQTVAGVQPIKRVFAPLRFPYRIILREEGENDGLVSFRSARWKESRLVHKMDADHFNQIGWWDPSEAGSGRDREAFEAGIRKVYLDIAKGLKD